MKTEVRQDVVCSFCDRAADELTHGSMFNREGKAVICTDCIQVCIEVLCARSTCIDFKPVSSSEGGRNG